MTNDIFNTYLSVEDFQKTHELSIKSTWKIYELNISEDPNLYTFGAMMKRIIKCP